MSLALTDTVSTAAQHKKYRFNLSTQLYAARYTFQHGLGDHTLLYSPDWEGMPIIVPNATVSLIEHFRKGSTVLKVAYARDEMSGAQLQELVRPINFLYERGFLRESQDPERYTPVGPDKATPLREFEAWVHINNNCNLACSYCFVKQTPEAMTPATASMTAKRMGDVAKAYNLEKISIKFSGGEPTLALPMMSYFYDCLVDELRESKTELAIAILTNGTHITGKVIEFVKRSNASVNISLDGFGEDHDRYRVYKNPERNFSNDRSDKIDSHILGQKECCSVARRGSWKKISENILLLISEGIVPNINGTISQESCGSLPDLVRWVFRNGMRNCRLGIVRQAGCSWQRGPEREEAFERYARLLIESFERAFAELESPDYLLALPNALTIAELSFALPAPDQCCGIGMNHMVVRHDGNLAACPMRVNEECFEPVEDLLKTMQQSFTDSPADRKDDGVCLACQWYRVCSGGCTHANKQINGHAFTKSPLCSFWKYVIPRYVIFYGYKMMQAQTCQDGGAH